MRIISGKYKNKQLQSPNSSATHPMGERERLAIFNMLGDLTGKTVLDLFAGTGALGIEALSRGAKNAVFVENNPKTFQILKRNLELVDGAKAVKSDVNSFETDERFDIVFVDPPYDMFSQNVLEFEKFVITGGTMVVSSPEPLNDTSRKYANCFITLV